MCATAVQQIIRKHKGTVEEIDILVPVYTWKSRAVGATFYTYSGNTRAAFPPRYTAHQQRYGGLLAVILLPGIV